MSLPSPSPRFVVRSTAGLIGSGLGLVIVLYLVADAVLRGQWQVALRWTPWLLGSLWVVFVLTAASRLLVTDDGVVVQNYLRRHWVPWGAVRDISPRHGLTLRLETGQEIACVAFPTLRPGLPLTRLDQYRGDAARELIIAFEQRLRHAPHVSSGSTATHTWDRASIVTGVVLAAMCVVSLAAPWG